MEQTDQKPKTAIIIGAGPAGLTAAYELLERTDIIPIVIEKSSDIGGISKTVNYKGNRIDIGGHRFFSKSERVMNWWLNILPVQHLQSAGINIRYHGQQATVENQGTGPDPDIEEKVMLIRNRLSRIFYLRKFFNYPVSADLQTLSKLGFIRSVSIIFSYFRSVIFPVRPETTLEDFFINRFGKKLYVTFFKDYTEKVWGIPPAEINAEWGKQRIKKLSVSKAVIHSLKKLFKTRSDIYQKDSETSLIEQFLYPKYGPGQMWEEVARKITENGGELKLNCEVVGLKLAGSEIVEIEFKDQLSGKTETLKANYFFSSMPVKDLVNALDKEVPEEISEIAKGLVYRDFISTGLLLNKLKKQKGTTETSNNILPDNWIYIQESDVKVGRIQIINNWSPYMVNDRTKVWLGLEYFCTKGDATWNMTDELIIKMAVFELEKIGLIEASEVIDHTVIRMEKTYPGYFGTYKDFDKIINFTNSIHNLFLIGRNGMHRYNNQDHSMLTAMTAVDNIISGLKSKDNIWAVNTEDSYLEDKE